MSEIGSRRKAPANAALLCCECELFVRRSKKKRFDRVRGA